MVAFLIIYYSKHCTTSIKKDVFKFLPKFTNVVSNSVIIMFSENEQLPNSLNLCYKGFSPYVLF